MKIFKIVKSIKYTLGWAMPVTSLNRLWLGMSANSPLCISNVANTFYHTYITFSHHWQESIDFNTVRTTRSTGMYFLIHPKGWINDERMAVHCLESGCIRLYIPSDLEISLDPRDVPRASPSGHLSAWGNLLVVQPNTSLLSAVYVYSTYPWRR